MPELSFWDLIRHGIAAAPQFFADTRQVFAFLEEQYGYRHVENRIEHPDDVDGADARVEFVGLYMQVNVVWFFYNAAIQVFFAELSEPGVPAAKTTPYSGVQGVHRVIDLFSLAEVLGQAKNPAFLLGDPLQTGGRRLRKRLAILETNLRGVLEGLAAATQRYAGDVLRGDTTLFPQAMALYTEKMVRDHYLRL